MSFVFYNPKTNTIERRQPTQPNAFQMPYLLNIQPQDLNYAMKNTNDVRSYPSTVSYPQNYDQERPDKENVSYNRQPQPRPSNHQDTYKPSKEFLMMEDFNENDIGRTQTYKPSRDQNRNIQPQRTQELRRTSPQDKRERRSHPVQEEEAREEFNMMRPEDLILKYRPEDYSINERILNARFVREEQEKTRKFVLDRIGADIKVMEGKANEIEKDIQESEQETKALEAKTQQIWQEFERKKFELKAKEILNRIDDAIDADKEEEVDENRFDDFYNENRALYDEIDRVLDQDEGEEEVTYIQETDRSRGPEKPKYKATGYGRASSSGWRNPRITPGNRSNNYSNVHSSVNSRSKKGLDKMFGQKKAMNPVAKSKPNTVAKRPIGSVANQKSGVSQKNEVVFKNPKRVEDALQKAKAIVNLY